MFAGCMKAELNIGASAMVQRKQRWDKPKGKKVDFGLFKIKPPWRGNITDCKQCHTTHGENEICESNPEYKKFTS